MAEYSVFNLQYGSVGRYQTRAKGSKLSGSARQNYAKLLWMKVLHKTGTIQNVRRTSTTALTGAKQPINGEKRWSNDC